MPKRATAKPWQYLLVVVPAALLFFIRLGSRALWASEFRWAEIAREMALTGNYFWPTIDGRPYYDKPLGTYWLVLAASVFTGKVDEVAARIPCAIAGLLAVLLLIFIAQRLYDARTALFSGLVLATSFSFVFFSRHASADVETVAGELAALLLFLKNEERPAGWWVVGLWSLMALTSLTKGLLGFALPGLVIVSASCLSRGWHDLRAGVSTGTLRRRLSWFVERNRWLFNWKSLAAIAVGAFMYVIPFAISQRQTGSDLGLYKVYRENVVRFFHPFDHRGPVYLYLYVIFALMAPWSLFLPAALAELHAPGGRDRGPLTSPDRFVLTWFWATFIFFTLSGSRRSYYLLPILPAGALIVARFLFLDNAMLSHLARFLLKAAYAVVVLVVVGAVIVFFPPSLLVPDTLALFRPLHRLVPATLAALPPVPARWAFGLFWLCAVIFTLRAVYNFRLATVAASMAVIAYTSMAWIYLFVMPAADKYRPEKPFAAAVRRELHGDFGHLAFYRTLETLFYLDPSRPIPFYEWPVKLRLAAAKGETRWIITRERDLSTLGISSRVVLAEETYPWQGTRGQRNKVVLLKISREPAAAGAPRPAPHPKAASASRHKDRSSPTAS